MVSQLRPGAGLILTSELVSPGLSLAPCGRAVPDDHRQAFWPWSHIRVRLSGSLKSLGSVCALPCCQALCPWSFWSPAGRMASLPHSPPPSVGLARHAVSGVPVAPPRPPSRPFVVPGFISLPTPGEGGESPGRLSPGKGPGRLTWRILYVK